VYTGTGCIDGLYTGNDGLYAGNDGLYAGNDRQ